jgi:hypothetical protein
MPEDKRSSLEYVLLHENDALRARIRQLEAMLDTIHPLDPAVVTTRGPDGMWWVSPINPAKD